MSLDLTGSVLTELDLTNCRVDGRLCLDGAILQGQTRLRGMIVGGRPRLRYWGESRREARVAQTALMTPSRHGALVQQCVSWLIHGTANVVI